MNLENTQKKEINTKNIDNNMNKSNNKKICAHPDCKKKIKLLDRTCKCNLTFCKKHIFFRDHNCSFNYIDLQKNKLTNLNPKIVNKCLEVI